MKILVLCCLMALHIQILAQGHNKTQESGDISIAGQWKFRTDPQLVGETDHWQDEAFSGPLAGIIRLPGSTDEIKLGDSRPLFKSPLGNKPPLDYPSDADYGMLTRQHKFIGVAWYQKEVIIPSCRFPQSYSLYLERVMWRSKVWIDGGLRGVPIDYLSSPHEHWLGILSPGRHVLTLMIDNRQIYPIGALGHSYCPHMQTQWNGVVGRMALIPHPLVYVKEVNIFPSFKDRSIRIDLGLENEQSQDQAVSVRFLVREKKGGKVVASAADSFMVEHGFSGRQKEIRWKGPPLAWDEFSPNLYSLTTSLLCHDQSQKTIRTFGFRDMGVADKHITLNGKKIMIRNSHEGMFFGNTGYPAMDVAYWKKVFMVYKAHGLNGVRFHSSCPPAEAFTAADELGIYLQIEFFWMDSWMGYKDLIGGKNDTLNEFVRNELREAVNCYGNHPSLMFVAIGNELGGNFDRMGQWIADEKREDPRHFYAAGIAHNITAADDFVEYGGNGSALSKTGTDWDYTDHYTLREEHPYDTLFRRKDLPEYTHESGQYIVHPIWKDMDRFKGVLAPLDMDYFLAKARSSGVDGQDSVFQAASGNINRILYKAQIEATLRTPQSAGYGLLGMVDYPGQGEAYIGWVDPFYKEKNFITPGRFREYGNCIVPLLRFPKFVWEDGDTLHATVEVSNYGPAALPGAVLRYSLSDEGDPQETDQQATKSEAVGPHAAGTQSARPRTRNVLFEGLLPPTDLVQGVITLVGSISHQLHSGSRGRQLTLRLSIAGTPYRNSWTIWVFPKPLSGLTAPADVFITRSVDTAIVALRQGRKVLLMASRLGPDKNKTYAAFAPVFWSATWFEGQETEVTGAVVLSHHPALWLFPTEGVTDWQWVDVCRGSRGFILTGLPKHYLPIVQPVDDYHFGKKLGSLFELRTAEGGKLLVCGYNLDDDLQNRPAARQLLSSLLSYMHSARFAPDQSVDDPWIVRTLTK